MPNRGLLHKASKNIDREVIYELGSQLSNSIYLNNPNFNKLEQSAATEPPGTFIHSSPVFDKYKNYILLPESYRNVDILANIALTDLMGPIEPYTWKEVERLWLSKIDKHFCENLQTEQNVAEFLLDLENYAQRSYEYQDSKKGPKEYSADWIVAKWYLNKVEKSIEETNKKLYIQKLGFGRLALSACVYHIYYISGKRIVLLSHNMMTPGGKSDIFCRTDNKNKKGYSFSKDYFDLCRRQCAYVKAKGSNDDCRKLCINKDTYEIYFKNEKIGE